MFGGDYLHFWEKWNAQAENSIYGAFHIFGHIHNNQNDIASKIVDEIPNIYNAGVDMCNFAPMTLDELMEIKR